MSCPYHDHGVDCTFHEGHPGRCSFMKRDPIDLKTLAVTTTALGNTTAAIALSELVAAPGFAPKSWQSAAPDTSYKSTKMPVQNSDDLMRIAALPRRLPTKEGTPEAATAIRVITRRYAHERNAKCECAEKLDKYEQPPRDCIRSLNLTQAVALYEIATYNGLLGPIGVGHGKTIITLLAPLAFRNCKKAVLLVPPTLVGQLIVEYEIVGQHFRMPNMIVHGNVKLPGDAEPRQYSEIYRVHPVTGEPEPVLHVFPYSRLSRPESTAKLEEICADVVLMDEAHKLRHADTATTARVLRYYDNHSDTRGLAVSGSITDSSVKDYAHIAAMCLQLGSPLPIDPDAVDDWSRALDPKAPKGEDTNSPWAMAAPPGALLDLDDGRGGHISEVYHRRLVETPGVVSTSAPAVNAELVIEEQKPNYAIPWEVEQHLKSLRDTWTRPDGEQLIDPLTVGRCARELACGFYYRWKFPKGEPVALILEWLDIRKLYRSELRYKLSRREEHLDSPYLCELAAKRHHGDLAVHPCPAGHDPREWDRQHPTWESEYWPAWRDIKGLVQPETETVEVDDYLARDAAEWGLANKGVVWYDSNAFGEWVARLSGLTKHGGGQGAGELLMRELKATKGGSVICSIKSHGTGRNGLQAYFCDQLIAQPPSSATTWEQLLGRLHRIGQKAPRVFARFYRHTPELMDHVDQALARALYVQTTLGSAQKLRSGFIPPERIKAVADEAPMHFDFAALTCEQRDDDDGEGDDEG